MKNTVFIEYDNSRLENLSLKIYNLFVENNYNTTILNNNISINEKNSLISNSTKPFVLSNKINNDDANAIENMYNYDYSMTSNIETATVAPEVPTVDKTSVIPDVTKPAVVEESSMKAQSPFDKIELVPNNPLDLD